VKREIPILITMVAGLFMLLAFFVPHPLVRAIYGDVQTWAIAVVGLTYVLGVANLLRINTRHVSRRERDWPFKIVLIAGLLTTMIVGFSEGTGYSEVGSKFQWIYRTFYSPMTATMFSLLAIAAFILMLGRVPLGNAIHPFLPEAADWLMEIPQNAAKRGILIGAALGVVATGMRVILGLEKTYGGDSSS
jgi:hypothetical protein